MIRLAKNKKGINLLLATIVTFILIAFAVFIFLTFFYEAANTSAGGVTNICNPLTPEKCNEEQCKQLASCSWVNNGCSCSSSSDTS